MALSSQRRRLVYVSHFPKYSICFFFVDDGKAGNNSFLFNRWSYDDVQVLVVFWRRIEVHVVWYFGNNYISSITFATSRSSSPRNFDRG
ncbi:hypothetical protein HanIR_Chr06g0271991 [Helianthus annuus]|nr:hypothetical protein HanIR_Chr06g0271991 [Helianthus annuus]